MLYQDNYFVVSVKLNIGYCIDDQMIKTHCIDDQDKFQSVTDTGNEFTEYHTPRKKLQWTDLSPVRLHAFTKTLRAIFQENTKYKLTVWKIESLILMIKKI